MIVEVISQDECLFAVYIAAVSAPAADLLATLNKDLLCTGLLIAYATALRLVMQTITQGLAGQLISA